MVWLLLMLITMAIVVTGIYLCVPYWRAPENAGATLCCGRIAPQSDKQLWKNNGARTLLRDASLTNSEKPNKHSRICWPALPFQSWKLIPVSDRPPLAAFSKPVTETWPYSKVDPFVSVDSAKSASRIS